MSTSAEALVAIELLSGLAGADWALDPGAILSVRAEVAAAWIADGLARRAPAAAAAPPEAAMRPRSRARG